MGIKIAKFTADIQLQTAPIGGIFRVLCKLGIDLTVNAYLAAHGPYFCL